MLTAVRAILQRTGRLLERNASFGSSLAQPAITNCSGHNALTCNSPAAHIHSGFSASFISYPKRNVSELPLALKAPDDIFLSKYGFEKPKEDDNIVFVCASGARSFRALRAVLHMGYKKSLTTLCWHDSWGTYQSASRPSASGTWPAMRRAMVDSLCATRSYSQSAKMPGGVSPEKHLAFEDLVRLIDRKEIYLIDVREPHELKETGELPDSVNIPLNELREALSVLSDKEFQKKYKARKPSFDTPLVFSCRSGARSLKALQLALELGYERSKHYKGGFLDWEAHTKKE